MNFLQNFRSRFSHLTPWSKFWTNNKTFLRSVHSWLDKGLYFAVRNCVHFLGFRCTKVYKRFLNGFYAYKLLLFCFLAKCPFCNIYLESTYNTNQKYLKIYFLIIFLKQILNTFLKRYFFKVKIELWPNISINICVNTLKRCEDDYNCETD